MEESCQETFMDILEHYAVRRSVQCLTFDELAQQAGGLYSTHTCIEMKYADKIYKRVKKEWKRNLNNPTLHTYDSKEVQKENLSYIIHIFRTPGEQGQKPRTHIDACVRFIFPKFVGYIRVFSFPCK